jgi:hypothetical protein
VRVRLTKKYANRIDGVDVSPHRVGDIVDLPTQEARLLLAEEWAVDRERRRKASPAVAHERRTKPSPRLPSDPKDPRRTQQ